MQAPILLARQTVRKSSRGPWLGDVLRAYARLAAVALACGDLVFPLRRGPSRNWIDEQCGANHSYRIH